MVAFLPEILGITASSLITLLLLRYEFRKGRELDIYYHTFETLIWIIPEIEQLCNSLQLVFTELEQINNELLDNEFGDFLIVRPLGVDINCLEYYINTHEKILQTLDQVETLTRKISYLSHNFKKNSESREILTKLALEPAAFIFDRYGKIAFTLSNVKLDRFIFPENFSNIFPTAKDIIDGEEVEYSDLSDYIFKIDDIDEIMNHFNKNNFK